MVEKSKVIGIMLQHSDGDKEYYEPELLKEDIEAIFKILEKYGDDNDSIRGDLKVIDQEENAEDIYKRNGKYHGFVYRRREAGMVDRCGF